MDFKQFLLTFFTVTHMAELMERRKPVSSVVFDQVFQRRENWPLARVRMDDIKRTTGNVAVVARGSQALPVGKASASITEIEPMPIRPSDFITGAELNDLKSLFGTGDEKGQALVTQYLDAKMIDFMQIIDNTRNALCAQAMTGAINYMMHSDQGYERYKVQYGDGTTLSYAPATKWNSPAMRIGAILKDLLAMKRKLNDEGFTGEIKFLAGTDVFIALVNKITALPNEQRMGATVTASKIDLAGFSILLDGDTYADRNSQGEATTKYEVDTDKIVAVACEVPKLKYCAIDDIDGNLEGVPFFAKSISIADPSGIKLVGESKPMPLVSAKGFCWATAYDGTIVEPDSWTINATNASMNADNVSVTEDTVDLTVYSATQLGAHTKAWILALATARGYDMTKTDADTKAEIITEFGTLQTAAQPVAAE